MKELFGETYQRACYEVYQQKYRLRNNKKEYVDKNVAASRLRVAVALASVEDDSGKWTKEFLWAMKNGAIPAGRIFSNAGASDHKTGVSLINCTVSDTISDSIDGIFGSLHNAAKTLASGAGIGYCFSTLRPKGAFVAGAGAETSGPLPFMDVYDKMCFTIASAGGRRGAQMATFDIRHPDVIDFIKAKRTDGRMRQFNLSCLITHEFMEAVKNNEEHLFTFPERKGSTQVGEFLYAKRPEFDHDDGYIRNEKGEVKCKVYGRMPARDLYNLIMKSTYEYAEPGFLLIDEVNEMNNLWWEENIRSTNPCAEQPLPENGSCLLGSVDLTHFVENPFTAEATFNWDEYSDVIRVFTRMLDNVCESSGLPLEEQREELRRKRRHGMGFTGLGSALAMLCTRYDSEKAVSFAEDVSRILSRVGYLEGLNLAKEKGSAPIMEEDFTLTADQAARVGRNVGDVVKGKELWARGSKFLPNLFTYSELAEFAEVGCRFTHHSSIAPTGTISFGLCNNVSGGIEPSFSHYYQRNIIESGKKTKRSEDIYSYEFLLYKELIDSDASIHSLPDYFITADSISPKAHIDIQAAAQKFIDSSISKTTNVATDFPFDEFSDLYMYAYDKGLKGCTTFRFNPEAFGGVLVNHEDLENMAIEFTLEDGSTVNCKGSDTINYDGEEHTASNLYDAIKEGVYGAY